MFKSIAVAIAVLLCASGATAREYTFTVIPAQPISGKAFKIRITKTFDLCGTPLHDSILPTRNLGAGVVQFVIPGSDGCEANLPAQDISYDVPALAAGYYSFHFDICGFFPVDCHTMEARAVAVVERANGQRATIPTVSSVGAASIALALLLVGACRIHRKDHS